MVRVDRTRNALLVALAPQLTLTTSIGLTSTTRETAVALSVVQVNCPILHITITQINLFFKIFLQYTTLTSRVTVNFWLLKMLHTIRVGLWTDF